MPYRIAGIDVHKKKLAVVVADVSTHDEYKFERRWAKNQPRTNIETGTANGGTSLGVAGYRLSRVDRSAQFALLSGHYDGLLSVCQPRNRLLFPAEVRHYEIAEFDRTGRKVSIVDPPDP